MGFVEVIMGNRRWGDIMFVRVANRRAGLLWTLARGGFPLQHCAPHSAHTLTQEAHFVQTARHDDFWSLHTFRLVLIILEQLVNPRVFHVVFAFQNTISLFRFTIRWFLDVSSSVAILDPISTFNIPDVNFKTVLLHNFMIYMHFNVKGESIKY